MEARPCEGPPHAASAFVCGMHTSPFGAGGYVLWHAKLSHR